MVETIWNRGNKRKVVERTKNRHERGVLSRSQHGWEYSYFRNNYIAFLFTFTQHPNFSIIKVVHSCLLDPLKFMSGRLDSLFIA